VNALNTFNFNAGEEAVFPDDEPTGGDENSNEVRSITLSGFPINDQVLIELSRIDFGTVAIAEGMLNNGGGIFALSISDSTGQLRPNISLPAGSYFITISTYPAAAASSSQTYVSNMAIDITQTIVYNSQTFTLQNDNGPYGPGGNWDDSGDNGGGGDTTAKPPAMTSRL
jgi:hypothetical protein